MPSPERPKSILVGEGELKADLAVAREQSAVNTLRINPARELRDIGLQEVFIDDVLSTG